MRSGVLRRSGRWHIHFDGNCGVAPAIRERRGCGLRIFAFFGPSGLICVSNSFSSLIYLKNMHRAQFKESMSGNRSAGITMVETVIWIAIFTIVMLALTSSVQSFYRTNKYAVEQAGAVSSAQRG